MGATTYAIAMSIGTLLLAINLGIVDFSDGSDIPREQSDIYEQTCKDKGYEGFADSVSSNLIKCHKTVDGEGVTGWVLKDGFGGQNLTE